ncbi:MAG: HlyD family efflux transporter periplasmic adaptor subunit [Eubacteriales bacterium]
MNTEEKVTSTGIRGRRKKNFFIPLLVVITTMLLLNFAWRAVAVKLAGVDVLSRQEASQSVSLEGVLIKEEFPARAPATGQVKFISQEGRRVEVGAPVAQVTVASSDAGGLIQVLAAPSAGVFCTHIDGLEGLLRPDNLGVLDLPGAEKSGDKKAYVQTGARVEKGQTVFKIIDNLTPVVFHCVNARLPAELAVEGREFEGKWENSPLQVKIDRILEKEGRRDIFFLITSCPDALLHNRQVKISLVTGKLGGLIVPRTALVEREGATGLYLAVKKRARWVPVRVEGEVAGKAVVSGNIEEGSRYVSNPRFVREGSRVD